jgi:hypothetical protein
VPSRNLHFESQLQQIVSEQQQQQQQQQQNQISFSSLFRNFFKEINVSKGCLQRSQLVLKTT